MKERRNCERFMVHDGVYVNCAQKVGKIRNISMTGLLCTCEHYSECLPVNFDISCPGSSICSEDIPCTIIDSKAEKSPSFSVKQCHVQFDPLPHKKNLELEKVIEKYSLRN
jgi:hypothetical protein